MTEARLAADAFCLQLPKEPQSLGCFQLRQLVDWATTNQCPRARREWAALQGQLTARPEELERLKNLEGAFETSLSRLCPQ
ncbi:hypothetical protein ACQKGO_07800 [Corallococcus interemptor]|uniref:hypothetical protein n=1 Tax=Corallococcus interemptor TaxID=2316720 RepID=UPI003D02DFB4